MPHVFCSKISAFIIKDLSSPVHRDCIPGDSEISAALTAAACKWEILPDLICCALPRTANGKEGHLAKDHYSFPSLSQDEITLLPLLFFFPFSPQEFKITSSD